MSDTTRCVMCDLPKATKETAEALSGGGMADALRVLSSPETIKRHAEEAQAWAQDAVKLVRAAPGGEAFVDDEVVAAEMLRRIDQRRGGVR